MNKNHNSQQNDKRKVRPTEKSSDPQYGESQHGDPQHIEEAEEVSAYVLEAREFSKAVEILADEYGRDIRDVILRGDFGLHHTETVRLAGLVHGAPHACLKLGQTIRSGNTPLLKNLIYGDVSKM